MQDDDSSERIPKFEAQERTSLWVTVTTIVVIILGMLAWTALMSRWFY